MASISQAYPEDQLLEQPAIGLFAELDWTTVSALQNLRRTRDLLLPSLRSRGRWRWKVLDPLLDPHLTDA